MRLRVETIADFNVDGESVTQLLKNQHSSPLAEILQNKIEDGRTLLRNG